MDSCVNYRKRPDRGCQQSVPNLSTLHTPQIPNAGLCSHKMKRIKVILIFFYESERREWGGSTNDVFVVLSNPTRGRLSFSRSSHDASVMAHVALFVSVRWNMGGENRFTRADPGFQKGGRVRARAFGVGARSKLLKHGTFQ